MYYRFLYLVILYFILSTGCGNGSGDNPLNPNPEPIPGVDLSISVTESADPLSQATNIDLTYIIEIENLGTETATRVLTQSFLDPSVQWLAAGASCAFDSFQNRAICAHGDIPASSFVDFFVDVRTSTTGLINARFEVSTPSSDVDASNDTVSESTQIVP
jgi:hypothetical protein